MPSIKILEKKQALAAELTEKLKQAQAGVLVNYSGITVEQDTALRKTLREAGVEYRVYKNTMTARACAAAGYADMEQYLTGMNALAVSSTDPVAAAKILKDYADKIETFNLVAGYIDGGVINAAAEVDGPYNKEAVLKKVDNIYNSVERILSESKVTGEPEGVIATRYAESLIYR